ncbi:MAG: histidine phosphatase family protein [Bacilli bacterium]|nr:histidine phosphatase family protein [Bacilli bacterium]
MQYFMRHGIDDESFVGGWSNISLTEEGIKEVKKTAIWIKNNLKIDNIYSSDITRAKQTAQIVGKELDITPIYLSTLREQNKGSLNGKLKSNLTKYEQDLLYNQQIDTVFPNGESLIDLYKRSRELLKNIKKIEGNNLFITHRGVINMIYYLTENINLDMNKNRFNVEHASVHVLEKKIRRIY